jgi:hypothetical protein
VALPGGYATASIDLLDIGVHKPPLHDKAVILEEELQELADYYFSIVYIKKS